MNISVSDFQKDLQNESQATMKILSAISDESLKQKVYNEGRSIGEIAWHITSTVGEIGESLGLGLKQPAENAPIPEKAAEIKDVYESSYNKLLEEINSNWNEDTLTEEINMYGEMWTKAVALQVLIRHEIHHRAQLTVLMRQAGLKVPGVYGPSKEEWAAMNMPSPR